MKPLTASKVLWITLFVAVTFLGRGHTIHSNSLEAQEILRGVNTHVPTTSHTPRKDHHQNNELKKFPSKQNISKKIFSGMSKNYSHPNTNKTERKQNEQSHSDHKHTLKESKRNESTMKAKFKPHSFANDRLDYHRIKAKQLESGDQFGNYGDKKLPNDFLTSENKEQQVHLEQVKDIEDSPMKKEAQNSEYHNIKADSVPTEVETTQKVQLTKEAESHLTAEQQWQREQPEYYRPQMQENRVGGHKGPSLNNPRLAMSNILAKFRSVIPEIKNQEYATITQQYNLDPSWHRDAMANILLRLSSGLHDPLKGVNSLRRETQDVLAAMKRAMARSRVPTIRPRGRTVRRIILIRRRPHRYFSMLARLNFRSNTEHQSNEKHNELGVNAQELRSANIIVPFSDNGRAGFEQERRLQENKMRLINLQIWPISAKLREMLHRSLLLHKQRLNQRFGHLHDDENRADPVTLSNRYIGNKLPSEKIEVTSTQLESKTISRDNDGNSKSKASEIARMREKLLKIESLSKEWLLLQRQIDYQEAKVKTLALLLQKEKIPLNAAIRSRIARMAAETRLLRSKAVRLLFVLNKYTSSVASEEVENFENAPLVQNKRLKETKSSKSSEHIYYKIVDSMYRMLREIKSAFVAAAHKIYRFLNSFFQTVSDPSPAPLQRSPRNKSDASTNEPESKRSPVNSVYRTLSKDSTTQSTSQDKGKTVLQEESGALKVDNKPVKVNHSAKQEIDSGNTKDKKDEELIYNVAYQVVNKVRLDFFSILKRVLSEIKKGKHSFVVRKKNKESFGTHDQTQAPLKSSRKLIETHAEHTETVSSKSEISVQHNRNQEIESLVKPRVNVDAGNTAKHQDIHLTPRGHSLPHTMLGNTKVEPLEVNPDKKETVLKFRQEPRRVKSSRSKRSSHRHYLNEFSRRELEHLRAQVLRDKILREQAHHAYNYLGYPSMRELYHNDFGTLHRNKVRPSGYIPAFESDLREEQIPHALGKNKETDIRDYRHEKIVPLRHPPEPPHTENGIISLDVNENEESEDEETPLRMRAKLIAFLKLIGEQKNAPSTFHMISRNKEDENNYRHGAAEDDGDQWKTNIGHDRAEVIEKHPNHIIALEDQKPKLENQEEDDLKGYPAMRKQTSKYRKLERIGHKHYSSLPGAHQIDSEHLKQKSGYQEVGVLNDYSPLTANHIGGKHQKTISVRLEKGGQNNPQFSSRHHIDAEIQNPNPKIRTEDIYSDHPAPVEAHHSKTENYNPDVESWGWADLTESARLPTAHHTVPHAHIRTHKHPTGADWALLKNIQRLTYAVLGQNGEHLAAGLDNDATKNNTQDNTHGAKDKTIKNKNFIGTTKTPKEKKDGNEQEENTSGKNNNNITSDKKSTTKHKTSRARREAISPGVKLSQQTEENSVEEKQTQDTDNSFQTQAKIALTSERTSGQGKDLKSKSRSKDDVEMREKRALTDSIDDMFLGFRNNPEVVEQLEEIREFARKWIKLRQRLKSIREAASEGKAEYEIMIKKIKKLIERGDKLADRERRIKNKNYDDASLKASAIKTARNDIRQFQDSLKLSERQQQAVNMGIIASGNKEQMNRIKSILEQEQARENGKNTLGAALEESIGNKKKSKRPFSLPSSSLMQSPWSTAFAAPMLPPALGDDDQHQDDDDDDIHNQMLELMRQQQREQKRREIERQEAAKKIAALNALDDLDHVEQRHSLVRTALNRKMQDHARKKAKLTAYALDGADDDEIEKLRRQEERMKRKRERKRLELAERMAKMGSMDSIMEAKDAIDAYSPEKINDELVRVDNMLDAFITRPKRFAAQKIHGGSHDDGERTSRSKDQNDGSLQNQITKHSSVRKKRETWKISTDDDNKMDQQRSKKDFFEPPREMREEMNNNTNSYPPGIRMKAAAAAAVAHISHVPYSGDGNLKDSTMDQPISLNLGEMSLSPLSENTLLNIPLDSKSSQRRMGQQSEDTSLDKLLNFKSSYKRLGPLSEDTPFDKLLTSKPFPRQIGILSEDSPFDVPLTLDHTQRHLSVLPGDLFDDVNTRIHPWIARKKVIDHPGRVVPIGQSTREYPYAQVPRIIPLKHITHEYRTIPGIRVTTREFHHIPAKLVPVRQITRDFVYHKPDQEPTLFHRFYIHADPVPLPLPSPPLGGIVPRKYIIDHPWLLYQHRFVPWFDDGLAAPKSIYHSLPWQPYGQSILNAPQEVFNTHPVLQPLYPKLRQYMQLQKKIRLSGDSLFDNMAPLGTMNSYQIGPEGFSRFKRNAERLGRNKRSLYEGSEGTESHKKTMSSANTVMQMKTINPEIKDSLHDHDDSHNLRTDSDTRASPKGLGNGRGFQDQGDDLSGKDLRHSRGRRKKRELLGSMTGAVSGFGKNGIGAGAYLGSIDDSWMDSSGGGKQNKLENFGGSIGGGGKQDLSSGLGGSRKQNMLDRLVGSIGGGGKQRYGDTDRSSGGGKQDIVYNLDSLIDSGGKQGFLDVLGGSLDIGGKQNMLDKLFGTISGDSKKDVADGAGGSTKQSVLERLNDDNKPNYLDALGKSLGIGEKQNIIFSQLGDSTSDGGKLDFVDDFKGSLGTSGNMLGQYGGALGSDLFPGGLSLAAATDSSLNQDFDDTVLLHPPHSNVPFYSSMPQSQPWTHPFHSAYNAHVPNMNSYDTFFDKTKEKNKLKPTGLTEQDERLIMKMTSGEWRRNITKEDIERWIELNKRTIDPNRVTVDHVKKALENQQDVDEILGHLDSAKERLRSALEAESLKRAKQLKLEISKKLQDGREYEAYIKEQEKREREQKQEDEKTLKEMRKEMHKQRQDTLKQLEKDEKRLEKAIKKHEKRIAKVTTPRPLKPQDRYLQLKDILGAEESAANMHKFLSNGKTRLPKNKQGQNGLDLDSSVEFKALTTKTGHEGTKPEGTGNMDSGSMGSDSHEGHVGGETDHNGGGGEVTGDEIDDDW